VGTRHLLQNVADRAAGIIIGMGWQNYYIGDACLCWRRGDRIDAEVSRLILQLYRQIKSRMGIDFSGIRDVVPSYNALAFYFDPAITDVEALRKYIETWITSLSAPNETVLVRHHVLPVKYTGPDLPRVAAHCKLSEASVIDMHVGAIYTVAMIGFRPHFPYLIGLDPRLETPRLESPRVKVPAGSVAIGGAQTGIYPSDSPGGWNIIGTTDPALLIAIQPGDIISFRPIEAER
jgi:KipI family sensor histidine kinase inhibitor